MKYATIALAVAMLAMPITSAEAAEDETASEPCDHDDSIEECVEKQLDGLRDPCEKPENCEIPDLCENPDDCDLSIVEDIGGGKSETCIYILDGGQAQPLQCVSVRHWAGPPEGTCCGYEIYVGWGGGARLLAGSAQSGYTCTWSPSAGWNGCDAESSWWDSSCSPSQIRQATSTAWTTLVATTNLECPDT